MNIVKSNNLSKLNVRHGFVCKNHNHFITNFHKNSDSFLASINNLEKEISTNLHGMKQTHSGIAHIVNEYNINDFYLNNNDKIPECDAIISQIPNICLVVITADCMPILITDKNRTIVSAIHCGWRGIKRQIIENTIDKITSQNYKCSDLLAVIGPCIAQQSYEVGNDVHDDVTSINKDYTKEFSQQENGKYLFNLKKCGEIILRNCGINDIEVINIDTYKDERFYSYRANTHGLDGNKGHFASFISLAKV